MFVCMSSEHCKQMANFHAWSGKMPRHDSLNLRKEVTLPINYQGTLSSCRDKLYKLATSLTFLRPEGYPIDISPISSYNLKCR